MADPADKPSPFQPFSDIVGGQRDEGFVNLSKDIGQKVSIPSNLADGKAMIYNASTARFEASTVGTASLADGSVTLNKMVANSVDSSKIVDGSIVNADVSAAAAIAYSKLNLAGSVTSNDIVDGTIVNADVNASAAIAYTKMAPFPGARYVGSTQAIVTNTLTIIAWAAAGITNTTYVTLGGTTQLVAQIAGVYHVNFGCYFPAAAAPVGERLVDILFNAATVITGDQHLANTLANNATEASGSTYIRMAVNDAITMRVRHQQGANLTWANDNRTYLSVAYAGA